LVKNLGIKVKKDYKLLGIKGLVNLNYQRNPELLGIKINQ
jgi:hypothetical protein